MSDPYNLERFVEAQNHNYESVLAELAAGQKRSHWMWYIFPQIAGLGRSSMAQRYAISGMEEADWITPYWERASGNAASGCCNWRGERRIGYSAARTT